MRRDPRPAGPGSGQGGEGRSGKPGGNSNPSNSPNSSADQASPQSLSPGAAGEVAATPALSSAAFEEPDHPEFPNKAVTEAIAALTRQLHKTVVAEYGDARVTSKSTVAWHEAGHAVVDAIFGIIPTEACIRRERSKFDLVEQHGKFRHRRLPAGWTGYVSYARAQPFFCHALTLVADDYQLAVRALGGVVSEWVFDREHFCGSNVNEIATSIIAAEHIARKTGTDPHSTWNEIWLDTRQRLMTHRTIVAEIADELLHMHTIKQRRLRGYLRPIIEAGKDARAAWRLKPDHSRESPLSETARGVNKNPAR